MTCLYCGTLLPEGAMFCVECGRAVRSTHQPSPAVGDTAVVEPLDSNALVDQAVNSEESSAEQAVPLVEPEHPSSLRPGQAFVFQFSTGEVVTVTGSGLIGRNPVPQPSEYFDHLVTIVDPARSVSKSHLEFGQERGVLWVSDRFSGNGTVLLQPGEAPKRCEPGRRYEVARGSRVDIAEQYIIVS